MNEIEKITINLSVVDLGQIDLLVEEGLYSNRTDFIRAGVRLQLNQHGEVVKQAIVRKSLVVGVLVYTRATLEKSRAEGKRLAISAIGLVVLADDIPAELASEVIESLKVKGVLRASKAVREAISDRMM